jgi:inner membrane protein
MDPLTHIATGLLLGRAGMNRWTPAAGSILVLAANAPDIDIVTAAGGSLNYLHYHRHLTHSLVAAPVLAILTVALVRMVRRKPVRWVGAFAASLAAVASHLFLDWTNVYGIRLLLPFSSAWLRLDLTPVIDIWIWSALFLAFAGPFLARLVTTEITSGKPGKGRSGAAFAWLALAFVLAYTAGRGVLHERALAVLNARLYSGAAPVRVAAFPLQNPMAWRGLVETTDSYAVESVDLTVGQFNPGQGQIFFKPQADPVLEAAHRAATFQIFLQFSQFPLWRVAPARPPGGGRDVAVLDMRFGTPAEPGFQVRALVDQQGVVSDAEFQFGRARAR